MSEWLYQIRIKVSESISDDLRGMQKQNLSISIKKIADLHQMTIVCTYDAFKAYCDEAEQDQAIDLKRLSKNLNFSNLSFGSPERLMQNLGVRPGAVTPLSMINGVNNNVSLFMDKALRNKIVIYVHPLVNDRTIEMTIE
ncbi:hypothetical protein N9311_04940, partial [Amylibacter sp.]|nr:hypothetical protein [Amylibacter sp.]